MRFLKTYGLFPFLLVLVGITGCWYVLAELIPQFWHEWKTRPDQ